MFKNDRLRLKYMHSQNRVHYQKFSQVRKELKATIKSKMRANLTDPTNPNTVTKKFWSYVKYSSYNSRIPDSVFRNDIFAKNPIRQAELFNNFFYDQFLTKRNYSIGVDFSSDYFIDFKFDENKIIQVLLGLDTNKSSGPDEILGMVLKIAYTLSPSHFPCYLTYPLVWTNYHLTGN